MANLQSKPLIELNLDTREITITNNIKYIDIDKNIANIFLQIYREDNTGLKTYLTKEELDSFVGKLFLIKPVSNNSSEITGINTEEFESDNGGGVLRFIIPTECTNRNGIVKCEVHISKDNELLASDRFVYNVKQSLVTQFNDSLLEDSDFPILQQLILETQKASNIDDTRISKTTTYSSYKIDSQIKDKATIGEVRENTSIKPINHTEFDTETKQLFTGGAVAVVGEKAVGEENLKDYAVTSAKRTTTGSSIKICSLSTIPIMLDINNKTLILPESEYNLIYYNNKFDKLGNQVTIDVSGNGTTCSLYYDTLAKSFKVFEKETLNENCILVGTVYWNNVTGKYINSDLNCDYVIKNNGKINEKTLVKISSEIVYPEGKSIRIYSQNPLNIDLVNKKLKIDKTGYCKVLVDGYLENIQEEEIDISIDAHHVAILYNKSNNTLFASTLQNGESDTSKNNYLLGVIDIENPYKSTIQCNFTVNGISYEDNLLSLTTQPKSKEIRIFSQNPLNIDLVNKKIKINKIGYCKVLVDGYLINVQEDEIDISIDDFHVCIFYNKANNTLFPSIVPGSESDTTKNNYLLGVIDIKNPYKSTIQCNFVVNGISYEDNLLNKQWFDKKIGCLGDSITFGAGGTSWVTKLKELTGCKEAINYGISGTTIETNSTGKSFVERYSNMADDLDLICVWGGVNDHHWTGSVGRVFGDINTPSTQIDSFYGALKHLCEGLLNKYPSKKIMFITPMKNKGYVAGSTTCPAWNETNGIGKTLTDYRNAILEVCDFYSIPVLDLYSCSGISPENETQVQQLMPDRLHPNTKGNLEILAPKIASFMNNL